MGLKDKELRYYDSQVLRLPADKRTAFHKQVDRLIDTLRKHLRKRTKITITRIVKVTCFVSSAPAFTGQAQVANGASEFLIAVLGDAGRHARSAVGMSVLPLDSPVEVELIAEVHQ